MFHLSYFLSQNDAISTGKLNGTKLNLQVLGIGDGIIDALSQYPGYIEYAENNPYFPLVSPSLLQTANQSMNEKDGCLDRVYMTFVSFFDTDDPENLDKEL